MADKIVPCSKCVFEQFGECYLLPPTVIGVNGGPMYCRAKAKGGCGQGKTLDDLKEVPKP